MNGNKQFNELKNLVLNIKSGIQICKTDDNFTILYVNYEFCRLIGYTADEIKTLFNNQSIKLWPSNKVEQLKNNIKEQLESSNRFTVDYQMIRKDGTKAHVIVTGELIQYCGSEKCVHCVFTDVTTQKRILDELKEKSFEIETLTDNLETAIVNCDITKDYQIKYANEGLFYLIGYTREQFKSECQNYLRKIIHPDDVDNLYKTLGLQFESSGVSKNIYRIIKRDGSIIWVLERGAKISTSNGEIEFHGVITNITQEEQNRQLLVNNNEKLLLSEKRYAIAMENSKDIIFDYIIDTKEIECTDATLKNIDPHYSLAKNIEAIIDSGLVHKNSIDELREIFNKIDNGAIYVSSQITILSTSGKEVLFEVSLTNVFDENNNAIRAIGVIRNINEKRMLQSEKKYGKAMTADKLYTNELNITLDRIVSTNENWAKSLGLLKFYKVSEMVDYMCKNFVHVEYEQSFRDFFDKEKISAVFHSGQTQISLEYRQKGIENVYTWVEISMNIICDDITNDIRTRLYIKDINERKEKEIRSFEEKRFYEAMVSNSVDVYKVNITKDLIFLGSEYYDNQDYININSYTDFINQGLKTRIHPEDISNVKSMVLRENILSRYENGESKIVFEYRKLLENGSYMWTCCDAHLFQDPKTNDIRGFCYIQDINEKKLKELDILYKSEHDSLTGFYNKGTAEKYIEKYLDSDDAKIGKHAFFIFDIDNFRTINNTFGHLFGDVILSRTTQKIRDLFRDVDILGRIGGDEFIALMKNISSIKSAISKAKEICNVVKETYDKNDKQCEVTMSIGIAMCDVGEKHTYAELYRRSDAALYHSKDMGRDQFSVYNISMESKVSELEKINETDLIESKSFQENISEYIFRILYESTDKESAINDVLSLIGKQYNVNSCYIFELSNDNMSINNTFLWSSNEDPRYEKRRACIPNYLMQEYVNRFDENGVFYISNLSEEKGIFKSIFESYKIEQLLQFPILKNNIFSGFIGFDQCSVGRTPTKTEITELRNISYILGVFINEMRATKKSEMSKNSIVCVVDSLANYAYVVDKVRYELLFINNSYSKLVRNAKIGYRCYSELYNRDEPCEFCPMNNTNRQNEDNEVYLENLDIWIKTSASEIDWIEGNQPYIINATDITKYKCSATSRPIAL